MIEALTATYVLLSRAGHLLSTRPSPATLWRWAAKGVDGVQLETFKIGGRRYTTAEALERFVARLSASRPSGTPPPSPSRLEEGRKAHAAARAKEIYGG
jgi:hypothetical protein